MLAAFSRRTCHSRLLSLRSLVTETSTSAPAEEVSTSTPSAAPGEQQPAGQPRTPAWWSDPKCDATRAYHIISKRFKVHGPQKEENYRQLINRVNNPQEAALALNILDEGRRVRAMLQQHVPFTFATSQLLIKKCVETEAHDVALEALQRANEVGLQFFRADAYYAVMKAAVLAGRLDAAIGVFEAMKQNGVRPGSKVVHNLIMGSIINGRRDLAEAYAEEFRFNGIKINSASQEWLDGTRLPNSERNSSEVSPRTTDGEATADQQKATVIANA